MKLILKSANRTDYKFLYKLLKQKDKRECISHKEMPSYGEHTKFNEGVPYKEDYVVYKDKKPIGRVYISWFNEIGIHLIRTGNNHTIKKLLLEEILKDRQEKYYMNVSPKNKEIQKILKQLGFGLIQYTYESFHTRL